MKKAPIPRALKPASPGWLAVYAGTQCTGHVLARGPLGFEAFNTDTKSLGTFATVKRGRGRMLGGGVMTEGDPFPDLPRGHYRAILADPPWRFEAWSGKGTARAADNHYATMTAADLVRLPVQSLAADDCVLFLWACWPTLADAFNLLGAWGFKYKTCAFSWTKAHAGQIEMFRDDVDVQVGLGYWTRANAEPCLLATRGKPKRIAKDVRQGIIAPRREHSRKPDEIHSRIERLVAGPYLELFARQREELGCVGHRGRQVRGGVMSAQPDMFSAASARPLIGVSITTPNKCGRCRGTAAVIGAGRGPHAASVICVCGRHRGWLPLAVFNFLRESVSRFGRPTAPIEVRLGNSRQRAPGGTQAALTNTAIEQGK